MSGIIHRGSPKHNLHLRGLEIEKAIKELKLPIAVKNEDGKPDPNSGPTVEAFVKAGYDPKNYPPAGYNSKSTDVEIANAILDYKPKPEAKLQTSKPDGEKKPEETKK